MNLKERKSAFGQVNHEAIGKLIQRLREAGLDYTVAWGSGEMYDEAADALEDLEGCKRTSQSAAVKVVDDVAGLRIGQNDGSSLTGYSAGYQTACEEIRYRLEMAYCENLNNEEENDSQNHLHLRQMRK